MPSRTEMTTAPSKGVLSRIKYMCARWRKRTKINAFETLVMSPWEKLYHHGFIPWKFILTVLLIIGCTSVASRQGWEKSPYYRASLANWRAILTPPHIADSPMTMGMTNTVVTRISTLDDLRESVVHVINTYYSIDNIALDRFEYAQVKDPIDGSLRPKPIVLDVDRYSGTSFSHNGVNSPRTKHKYKVWSKVDETDRSDNSAHEDPLYHPFLGAGTTELKEFLRSLYTMTAKFELQTYDINDRVNRHECVLWEIIVKWTFDHRAHIRYSIDASGSYCSGPVDDYAAYHAFVMIVSVVLQLLVIHSITTKIRIYRHLANFPLTEEYLNNSTFDADGGAGDRGILDNTNQSTPPPQQQQQPKKSGVLRQRNKSEVADQKSKTFQQNRGDLQPQRSESQMEVTLDVGDTGAASTHVGQMPGLVHKKTMEEIMETNLEEFETSVWDEMTISDKFTSVFTAWFFCSTIACTFNFIVSVWAVYGVFHSPQVEAALRAFGCWSAWISVLQFFESTPQLYVVISTLRRGALRVVMFITGVLPVFFGFAYAGIILFASHSEYFSNLDQACVTLFSLLNGDMIHDSFDELYVIHPLLSRVYMYLFLTLFICAVLNIFIAIIEDSFVASQAFKQMEQENQMGSVAQQAPRSQRNSPPREQSNTSAAGRRGYHSGRLAPPSGGVHRVRHQYGMTRDGVGSGYTSAAETDSERQPPPMLRKPSSTLLGRGQPRDMREYLIHASEEHKSRLRQRVMSVAENFELQTDVEGSDSDQERRGLKRRSSVMRRTSRQSTPRVGAARASPHTLYDGADASDGDDNASDTETAALLRPGRPTATSGYGSLNSPADSTTTAREKFDF